ncbi:unnamed protein product [Chondrus crispus]|uniref:Uncharacterized protein n=1 Tax=Chondrus crispus TaxID=2769 RepID=R7QBP7_CHOCR|nr:unnamed protein product [Chondrus crispus]CDF34851.1 unnamed protein product [Chondrus crispus]|eukprot:XP_005714670.1 unnamed protein product [Chondrus crispus]
MVKLNTSFGPTIKTLGTNPLNRAPTPSFLSSCFKISPPLTPLPKSLVCRRVLITSSGLATVMLAKPPTVDATNVWPNVASLKLSKPKTLPFTNADAPKSAKLPGALRAAVQPAPRYRPARRSSLKMASRPRPRSAAGLFWLLILRTSSGSRTTSPTPTTAPASAWSHILPFPSPAHASTRWPKRAVMPSRTNGWPPNLYTRCRILYAAANERPGKSEVYLRSGEACAWASRKITREKPSSAIAEVIPGCRIGVALFIRRFAIVSTGWKPNSSTTPANALPDTRAKRTADASVREEGDGGGGGGGGDMAGGGGVHGGGSSGTTGGGGGWGLCYCY